jgi:putative inorganic carbon (hco3(-)) transporter
MWLARHPFWHTEQLLSAAQYLAFGSAVAILFSIAVSQILMALALVALLLSKAPLRLPRIWLPLALFLLLTLVSLAFSGDVAWGLPQVRKIYVYSMLLVVFSLFRDTPMVRWLVLSWAGVGMLEAARGLVQFAGKYSEARALGRDFYRYYEPERITGFMSHWMTFGGEEMFVLLMLTAYLFWSPSARKRGFWFFLLCFGALCAALLAGYTRSIWVATAAGGLYLLWFWKRRLIAFIPIVLLVGFLAGPASLRARFQSIFHPGDNEFRLLTWRTGLRMVEAHPWLGVGPEQIKPKGHDQRVSDVFMQYLPPGAPSRLPSGWYGHLHNIYLQYAAERGIPAMLAVVWMLLLMLTDFWKALRHLPPGPSDRRFVLHGAIAVVIATMVAGFFEHNLGDSEVLTMFLVVAACGYLAAEKEPAVA